MPTKPKPWRTARQSLPALLSQVSFFPFCFSCLVLCFVLFPHIEPPREGEGKLAAAVGDGTARVWQLPTSEKHSTSTSTWEKISTSTWVEEKLSHPSYVYTAQFHPASSTLLATGGFDRVIRLWGCSRAGKGGYQVVQELPGHIDHLNCLAFDLDGHFLFSGDAGGVVRMWESPEPTAPLGSSTDSYSFINSLTSKGSWRSKREYRVEGEPGREAHSICSLSPHPGGMIII